jgi:poly(A) polymerase
VLGFCGGVGWALLVAKMCIDYPNLLPNKLLAKFYRFYEEYEWAYNKPVTLENIIYNDAEAVNVKFDVSDALFYCENKKNQMPIITPAFPAQNITHSISASTKNVILTELEKGRIITEALIAPGASQDKRLSWKRLFKKFPFFCAY